MSFVILIFIWIFSLAFAIHMFWTLALCLDVESAKNIQVLQILIWGIGRLGIGILILIWIWSLVFDIMIIQILALSWFWRCKKPPCHLSPEMGALEDAVGSWVGFNILILVQIQWMKFDGSIMNLLMNLNSPVSKTSFFTLMATGRGGSRSMHTFLG